MKIFRISQGTNSDYDTFDSAVVIAPDEETAKNMDPANGKPIDWPKLEWYDPSWCKKVEDVEVEYIGEADSTFKIPCVICASFNAG